MIKKNGTQKPRKSQNNAGPLSFREFGEFCVRKKGTQIPQKPQKEASPSIMARVIANARNHCGNLSASL